MQRPFDGAGYEPSHDGHASAWGRSFQAPSDGHAYGVSRSEHAARWPQS
ncbi:MAG TPA: hypothetical protein VHB21_26575 [Minicystis sp.]|nr:hypothetical protein [Minicystis sp.]